MLYLKSFIDSMKSSSEEKFICGECGEGFLRRVSDVKRRLKHKDSTYVFCSNICFSKHSEAKTKCQCEQCGVIFCKKKSQANRTHHHFCSSSCAATHNNAKRKKKRHCVVCEQELTATAKKYCSSTCQNKQRFESKVSLFSAGRVHHRPMLRKILGHLNGDACSICHSTHWLELPILLIVDHINGDSSNDMPDNLRLVCSNCDATLPTYKAKNKGRGRSSRR